ncbi:uncharacterized protein LOC111040539 isoform X2 [Myzus persicae]|nr:uncharacterized protein LOC111040539 isoform X2 [Myzus persicae]
MDISDSESTVSISEISVDENYDEIKFGKQAAVHEELYSTDQNEQSGSSNYVNVVNNNDSDDIDYDEENVEGEDLIAYDISLALPTIHEHTHNRVHTREYTLDQSHEQLTHQQRYEHTLEKNSCHRPACNKIVTPVTRRNKPRAAAIEAAAKIAIYFTKKKQPNSKRNGTTLYYSCGHREKIGGTSLKHIGIKTPAIMKESRLLDERLMKTTCYVSKLPAALTVHQILHDFQKKANLCVDFDLSMDLIFTAFNHALPAWCLYSIEKLQYDEIIKKYPNRQVSELYGLAHLFRFIVCLPRLYNKMRPHHTEFNVRVTAFMNELMDYVIEENLRVDIEKDYEHVMPEYHRLNYWHIQHQI